MALIIVFYQLELNLKMDKTKKRNRKKKKEKSTPKEQENIGRGLISYDDLYPSHSTQNNDIQSLINCENEAVKLRVRFLQFLLSKTGSPFTARVAG